MKNDFPKKEAKKLINWMREQMYGDKITEWTYGNEHDRMSECAGYLNALVDKYEEEKEE